MKIVVDTNVLVRVFANDDEGQNQAANAAMDSADGVVLTLPMLCELAWVLSRGYRTSRKDIATTFRSLIEAENVEVDRAAVEAGLDMLDAGGDFADGVIAYQGRWAGAEAFVSFDRQAVKALTAQGQQARLLS